MDYIKQDATMRTTWLTRNTIMSGLSGRLSYDDTTTIGIVLEGFCYGETFRSAVIIDMINYSCPGLYSAVFVIYMQYHASKELGINKRNIFVYALCILYMLSTAMIALDVTCHVVVSKTCIHHNNFSLHTIIWIGPSFDHALSSRSPPLLCFNDNNWLMRFLFSGNLSMHEVIIISIIYIHSSQFSKIYRCWVVWGRNIRVIIIPSILAFAFLGQSIIYHALLAI